MNIIENKNYCNTIIHDVLGDNAEYILCPFCDVQINTQSIKKMELCCSKQNLINDTGIEVCSNCGIQSGNNSYIMPSINFYENKTIYNRQYHVQNIINNYKQQILYEIRNKIYKYFKKIEGIQSILNKKYNRKRIISIHYIIRRILVILNQKYKFITLPKQNKTIQFYKEYFQHINELIGKDINIIKK